MPMIPGRLLESARRVAGRGYGVEVCESMPGPYPGVCPIRIRLRNLCGTAYGFACQQGLSVEGVCDMEPPDKATGALQDI
jgi:hypothetical protein